jgi:hypothetical protein
MDIYSGPDRRTAADRSPDTTALVGSTFAIIGATMLLLAFGGALAIDVAEGIGDGAIATQFGTWAVVSAVLGTFVGCLVGGLMGVRHGVSSAIGHGIAATSGAIVLGALLGVFGLPGLIGSALVFTGAEGGVVVSIGWSGWALVVAVAASMLVGIAGWIAGLALQPRATNELRVEEHRFVRPSDRVRSENGRSLA